MLLLFFCQQEILAHILLSIAADNHLPNSGAAAYYLHLSGTTSVSNYLFFCQEEVPKFFLCQEKLPFIFLCHEQLSIIFLCQEQLLIIFLLSGSTANDILCQQQQTIIHIYLPLLEAATNNFLCQEQQSHILIVGSAVSNNFHLPGAAANHRTITSRTVNSRAEGRPSNFGCVGGFSR